MLHPDDRITLIDALRPPPGCRLDFALGATYSLDLDALLAVPAAFALHGVDDALDRVNPLTLLDSVRRHRDRIVVYHQAGQMTAPRYRALFAFLENWVIPVEAPRGGVFHPKFWALRYVDTEEQRTHHRVVVSSRNLTGDRSWDVVLRLDSTPTGASDCDLSGLTRLIRSLPRMAATTLTDRARERTEQLAAELDATAFALPHGVDALRVHAPGIEGHEPGTIPLPERVDRLLVISPFLSRQTLGALPPAHQPTVVVSRPEAIDSHPDALGGFRTLVLDETAVVDQPPGDTADPRSDIEDPPPGSALVGLHAKVYAYDLAGRSHVLIGSANATRAAFHDNVELLAELSGSPRAIGIAALEGNGRDHDVSFWSMLVDYTPQPHEPPPPPASPLDALRRSIGAAAFHADVAAPADGEASELLVTYRAPELTLPAGVTATCRPITIDGEQPLIGTAGTVHARFPLAAEQLTAFLAIRLADAAEETRFVVRAELHDAPSDRDRTVVRHLIGDGDQFVRYLLYLIADETDSGLDIGDLSDPAPVPGRSGGARRARESTGPLLEHLLRALRTDPVRLQPVAELVEQFATEPDVLPPGLLEVWEPIEAIAEERWT